MTQEVVLWVQVEQVDMVVDSRMVAEELRQFSNRLLGSLLLYLLILRDELDWQPQQVKNIHQHSVNNLVEPVEELELKNLLLDYLVWVLGEEELVLEEGLELEEEMALMQLNLHGWNLRGLQELVHYLEV